MISLWGLREQDIIVWTSSREMEGWQRGDTSIHWLPASSFQSHRSWSHGLSVTLQPLAGTKAEVPKQPILCPRWAPNTDAPTVATQLCWLCCFAVPSNTLELFSKVTKRKTAFPGLFRKFSNANTRIPRVLFFVLIFLFFKLTWPSPTWPSVCPLL